MGLDQTLNAHIYVGGADWSKKSERTIYNAVDDALAQIGIESPGKDETYLHNVTIVKPVGYWRKANAIHKWFVDEVQGGVDDCREHFVPEEKLDELAEVCREVLNNKKRAQEILPPQPGFFFGSTEVDDYYFEDVKYTIKVVEKAKEFRDQADKADLIVSFYYESSW